MTKQEFKTLHKICQKEWMILSKTGSEKHTSLVKPFYCSCPACEISKSTAKSHKGRCIYCPINMWRNADGVAACVRRPSPFASWGEIGGDLELNIEEGADEETISEFREALKEQAQEITKLKWSWLPEYEHTQLTEKVKEAIRLFEESEQH